MNGQRAAGRGGWALYLPSGPFSTLSAAGTRRRLARQHSASATPKNPTSRRASQCAGSVRRLAIGLQILVSRSNRIAVFLFFVRVAIDVLLCSAYRLVSTCVFSAKVLDLRSLIRVMHDRRYKDSAVEALHVNAVFFVDLVAVYVDRGRPLRWRSIKELSHSGPFCLIPFPRSSPQARSRAGHWKLELSNSPICTRPTPCGQISSRRDPTAIGFPSSTGPKWQLPPRGLRRA